MGQNRKGGNVLRGETRRKYRDLGRERKRKRA
jgi:hypothetical protein